MRVSVKSWLSIKTYVITNTDVNPLNDIMKHSINFILNTPYLETKKNYIIFTQFMFKDIQKMCYSTGPDCSTIDVLCCVLSFKCYNLNSKLKDWLLLSLLLSLIRKGFEVTISSNEWSNLQQTRAQSYKDFFSINLRWVVSILIGWKIWTANQSA